MVTRAQARNGIVNDQLSILTMHINYYFLRQLTPALESRVRGSVISECYSQEKAELILRFETTNGSFHLRATLGPAFTCLSFPGDFQRARKNSVDLFSDVVGLRVERLQQHQFDRSFTIHLSDGYALLFKLHGNRSNVIVYKNTAPTALFRSNIGSDLQLQPGQLDRTIDLSYEAFVQNQHRLPSLYFTLGKIPWHYLKANDFDEQDIETRWHAVQQLFTALYQSPFYLTEVDGVLTFSLLSVEKVQRAFQDPLVAVTEFFQRYRSREGFDQELTRITGVIRKRIMQTGDSLERARARLSDLEAHDRFKKWADLLMANLHLKPAGDRVVLPNFYDQNRPEEIRLQSDLSMQKNAAVYYSKSKKQQIEVKHLRSLISEKESALAVLTSDLDELAGMKDIKSLRSILSRHPVDPEANDGGSLPFHEHSFMGFRILVGKNATGNDKMIQRYGYKDDLWLHAKDVAGSHVLIKHQAGKTIPKPVIERAAQYAAWHSKRKTDTLCPVSVTPRKFVRKRKGDPPGAVVVERETVILVEPAE